MLMLGLGIVLTLYNAISFIGFSGEYSGKLSPTGAYWMLIIGVWGPEALRLLGLIVWKRSMFFVAFTEDHTCKLCCASKAPTDSTRKWVPVVASFIIIIYPWIMIGVAAIDLLIMPKGADVRIPAGPQVVSTIYPAFCFSCTFASMHYSSIAELGGCSRSCRVWRGRVLAWITYTMTKFFYHHTCDFFPESESAVDFTSASGYASL
ncbi:hypothetical protein Pelo_4620 [Pelomyxa schiedti]|nr:hypothetical protein Pelo_4620 [Pelomyxa schiedti]